MSTKPLNGKAYGSIPHLIGSRRGAGDWGVNEGEHRILTEKCRPGDRIIVQEKLDGTCVSIAMIAGEIVPLMRAGYRCTDSHYKQHHLFHDWVMKRETLFKALIPEGFRLCGEWLAQAHGTRYGLRGVEPFAPFDLMTHSIRLGRDGWTHVVHALMGEKIFPPVTLHNADAPFSIKMALAKLPECGGHGALDGTEGAVWRLEREGAVEMIAKYVRPEKIDGCHLESVTGKDPVWNWQP